MTETGCSSNCARSEGSTGSIATIRIASSARTISTSLFISPVPPSRVSSFVVVNFESRIEACALATNPRHHDVAEALVLLEFDASLLVQLEER